MDSFPDITPLLQSWVVLQTWAVRFFIFLGVLTLFPWIMLVLFDAGLYVWRYLILAPLMRFLYPNGYPSDVPVWLEDEVEGWSSVVTTATVRTRRRTSDTGVEGADEGSDLLDNTWKEKSV